ncbi:DUF4179 domain-containing protein [Faecalicatena sp. AGMB00832]|uniref:DUF4179 domain-containing protein n=1 Tax=Faecalicatena faecalis TaxID=2726362 RepID=A0ABS6DAD5_9FIRM|nr:DUF4179 domain-containing protein [Faecalicatena faecalis]MBU3878587.1 DUF4179 domain-containing protein [Faecalicatena faecalis]
MQTIFKEIEIPEKELNDVINQNLDKVHILYKKKQRMKLISVCAAVAVLLAAGFGICISNPVMASQIPLIGRLFNKVQDKQQYSGDYSKNVQPVKGANVSETAGIKVTLSELYCNTEALNVSVLVESNEAFPQYAQEGYEEQGEMKQQIFMDVSHKFDFMKDEVTQGYEYMWVVGEFLDDHTFAGAFRINFNIGDLSAVEIPDSFQWDMHINRIEVGNETGKIETFSDAGWDLSAKVTMDTEQTITKESNDFAPTGQGIISVTKTPYEIILNEADATKEGDIRFVLDADGKYMVDKLGMIPVQDHNVSKITIYYFQEPDVEKYVQLQERVAKGNDVEEFMKENSIYHIEIKFDE